MSNQKILYPLWFCLIVIIIVDIMTRFVVTSNNDKDLWGNDSPPFIIPEGLNSQVANKIIQAINDYETDVQIPIVTKGMSESERLAQEGNLNQVYTSDMRYRLIGVIKEKKAFAIVQQQNIKTKENTLIQISLFESLSHYKVTNILANKITLQGNDKREIHLFLYNSTNTVNTNTDSKRS